MDLQCLVIPRAGLVPANCKRLGEALHRWRSAEPAARSLDQPGLDELRDGELPPPRYVRHVRAAQRRADKALSCQEREDIRVGLGEGAEVRELECHVGGAGEGAARLAALGFGRAVPRHLVEDILIGGLSWDELAGPAVQPGPPTGAGLGSGGRA
jgi:hypothetical protein